MFIACCCRMNNILVNFFLFNFEITIQMDWMILVVIEARYITWPLMTAKADPKCHQPSPFVILSFHYVQHNITLSKNAERENIEIMWCEQCLASYQALWSYLYFFFCIFSCDFFFILFFLRLLPLLLINSR